MQLFKQKIRTLRLPPRPVLKQNEKKIVIIICLSVFMGLVFFGALKVAQPKIRRSQIESLVNQKMTAEQLVPLIYGSEDQKIQQTKAISVMFSPPYGATFTQVNQVLKEKEGELNRTIYYYPIVYDQAQIEKKYEIDPTKTTLIFFQKGKEKKRFVVEDLTNFNKTFIPELNRLPMWRLKETTK